VRVRLRMEVVDGDDRHGSLRAVVQVCSLADPSVVADAAELWRGDVPEGFDGTVARAEVTERVRKGARVWAPLLHLTNESADGRLSQLRVALE